MVFYVYVGTFVVIFLMNKFTSAIIPKLLLVHPNVFIFIFHHTNVNTTLPFSQTQTHTHTHTPKPFTNRTIRN